MELITATNCNKINACVALGFFDSVHLGHRAIINKTVNFAKSNDCSSVLVTFDDNFVNILSDKKLVYTLDERLNILEKLHLDYVLPLSFDETMQKKSPLEFLQFLDNILNIKQIFCGDDYSFGYLGKGDTKFLQEYYTAFSQEIVVKDVKFHNERVSSTSVRAYIESGDIAKANELLGEDYFVVGSVVHGRGEGSKMAIPTANLNIASNKCRLYEGVYGTFSIIDGKKYRSVTNVGAKPTYGIDSYNFETFVIDFLGNLYNKDIKVIFEKRLRDIQKFDNSSDLVKQINIDKNWQ